MDAKSKTSSEESAVALPKKLGAEKTTSALDGYEPSPEDTEELRRRIEAIKAGDFMAFQDYVEQVRERRRTLDN